MTAITSDALSLVPLFIQRTLRGSSQSRGQLSLVITNNQLIEMRAIYLETIPWLLQFYLHTIQIYMNRVPRGARVQFSQSAIILISVSLTSKMTLLAIYHILLPCLMPVRRHFKLFSLCRQRVRFVSLWMLQNHSFDTLSIRPTLSEVGIYHRQCLSHSTQPTGPQVGINGFIHPAYSSISPPPTSACHITSLSLAAH